MTLQEGTARQTQNCGAEGFRSWQGIDLLISFIGIASLGMHYEEINNSFFVSMAIIVMPVFTHLCVDYFRAKSKKCERRVWQRVVRGIIAVLSGTIVMTCLLGYIGVLEIYLAVSNDGGADAEVIIATSETGQQENSSLPVTSMQSAQPQDSGEQVVYMAVKSDYMFFRIFAPMSVYLLEFYGLCLAFKCLSFFCMEKKARNSSFVNS